MTTSTTTQIRNVAIIAHVDHGKTSLVDALLKQSQVFRANQQVGELVMDMNPLERERGITILAKNTAINYRGVKVNIIDTPGHADFSGEVERVVNMADGCLLVVDAVDGVMPQTRYVLKKALAAGLVPIVVINKVDRTQSRTAETLRGVQDLFLELATNVDQLDFETLYASAREGWAVKNMNDERKSMAPLFETIVNAVPPPRGDPEGPLQMLVAALDYDSHLGQIAIGRVFRGRLAAGDRVLRLGRGLEPREFKVERLYVFQGLQRLESPQVAAGEIVALAGVADASIGDTLASVEQPEALPGIAIEEPTVKMTIGVNTSPFAGKEGQYCTSRMLHARLQRELRTNISLRVQETANAAEFLVAGRGELHLTILIENIRREGYEIEVSRPEAVTRVVDGVELEPVEMLSLDTREEYIGPLTENLASRLAQLVDMRNDGQGGVHMKYRIPTRGLIGFRSFFLRTTRGNGVMNAQLLGEEPLKGDVRRTRTGVLVASEAGIAVTFGLNVAQGRGSTFIDAGTNVYEGMIVGAHPREGDIVINVCKQKKKTNVRSETADIVIRLTPPIVMSLEESLDFLADDELLEVTPRAFRLRKKVLLNDARQRQQRDARG
ncbi:MAG: translational GTPase TypA [SAR202 cluster bacterium]|nr:translational GTPase TypA [SAR202 cluster bacterium]